MSTQKFKLDSNAPTVSWADPRSGDSSANSQTKAVYVKILPQDVTEDQLQKLFELHGEITKVVLPPAKSGQEKRYGFVYFAERSTGMKALKNTEKYELDSDVLECSLAKPPADKKVGTGYNSQQCAFLLMCLVDMAGYADVWKGITSYWCGYGSNDISRRTSWICIVSTKLPNWNAHSTVHYHYHPSLVPSEWAGYGAQERSIKVVLCSPYILLQVPHKAASRQQPGAPVAPSTERWWTTKWKL